MKRFIQRYKLSITNHAIDQYIDRVLNEPKQEPGSELHCDVVDKLYTVNDLFEMHQCANGKYKVEDFVYIVIKDCIAVTVYYNTTIHSNYLPLPNDQKQIKAQITRRKKLQTHKRRRS